MSEYVKVVAFIFDLCGNEFTTQLLLVALMFIPAAKKRSKFFLRYPLSLAAIIGLQTLHRFGYFPVPEAVNYVIVTAMLIGVNLISFELNLAQSAFLAVCVYGMQHIISNVAYALIFFVMYLAGDYGLYQYYFVGMPLITAAGMACSYFFMVRRLEGRAEELKFERKAIIYIAITFVLVVSTLTLYGRQAIFWSLNGLVYLLLISTLFTCSTLIIGFMNLGKKQLEEENEILRELLHKDEMRYEQAKLSNEKIQIKYHDIKKRTSHGVVDYESLKEVESDAEIIKSTYFTGNRALDVILSEKALMCERLGIRFICTADGAAIKFMKPYHIYSLVGNALDNAIESLKDEEDESVKEIEISITRYEDMCIFNTSNFVRGGVVMSEGMPLTRKTDTENHGFGAKSMKNVVLKYGGQISFFVEGNIFKMAAIIPIFEAEDKKRNAKTQTA